MAGEKNGQAQDINQLLKVRREKLKELPIQVVRAIGKEIIYKDYDGYNFCRVDSKMAYFDNLDRWQKEFFIEQRLYKLYA